MQQENVSKLENGVSQASKPGGNFERISKELQHTRMGYGVRNDKDQVSELMRAAQTAEEVNEKTKPGPANPNEIVLDEHQMLKKICDERLQEFE